MQQHQLEFIQFLIRSEALLFGEFKTKAGRLSPYFVNTGKFDTGEKLLGLGEYYAKHIAAEKLNPDVLFGPAYKGISLAVTTGTSMARFGAGKVGVCFNRKEAKTHGDGGLLVGRVPQAQDRVVIVEDVISAGTTLREVVPMLRQLAQVNIVGVVIAVDRSERGAGDTTAVIEAQKEMGVTVFPIITVHHILAFLRSGASQVSDAAVHAKKIEAYLEQYGARG